MMGREDGGPHDGEHTGNKAENDAPLWFILFDQRQETRFKDVISQKKCSKASNMK